jgi:hypothetical protein
MWESQWGRGSKLEVLLEVLQCTFRMAKGKLLD